jgi:hypothetical protein
MNLKIDPSKIIRVPPVMRRESGACVFIYTILIIILILLCLGKTTS